MNCRNPLLSLILMLAAAASSASQTLGFTFEPLHCTAYYSSSGPYDCGFQSLSGSFTFDDVDGDGHIVLGELLHLSMPGISASGLPELGYPGLVIAFDYSAATGLSFSAYDFRNSVVTGDAYFYAEPHRYFRWSWIPITTLSVSPIPEPGTGWLLLAGGSVVVWRRLWPMRFRSALRR